MLKMIVLLQSRKRIKTKELAEALDVGERMVRKYIADLEEANIHVTSIPGPTGGYHLKGYDYLNCLDIDKNELVALKIAILEMRKNEQYQFYKELQMLGEKVNLVADHMMKYAGKKHETLVTCQVAEHIDGYGIRGQESFGVGIFSNNDIEREIRLQAAIITRNKVNIGYSSADATATQRIVRPYDLIDKGDFRYLIAFCEMRQEIRTFKVIRIQTLEVLNERFEKAEGFDIREFTKGQIGVFHDETISFKLLIRAPLSYSISERIIVPNQEIIWQEDKSIIYKATMTGKVDIIRWLLSMQSYVTILEPVELKNEVKNELTKMLDNI